MVNKLAPELLYALQYITQTPADEILHMRRWNYLKIAADEVGSSLFRNARHSLQILYKLDGLYPPQDPKVLKKIKYNFSNLNRAGLSTAIKRYAELS